MEYLNLRNIELYRVILEKIWSMCVSWGTLYSLQWSEKEWDYFYPTLKAGAAVSKVNNYGDSVLRHSSPKHTQAHSLFCIHAHTCENKSHNILGYIFLSESKTR